MGEPGGLHGVITRTSWRWILVACALAAGVAACSSSSTSSKPASGSTTPASGAAAEQTIAANWEAFFNAKTPVSKRIALLQDGQEFAPIINAQAGSSLASQASASVSKVTVTKPAAQAAVNYSILISGKSALPNQSGTSVYQDGTWKVGLASFCGLLALESGGSTSSLPAACKAAA